MKKFVFYIGSVFIFLFCLFPFIWTILTSLKDPSSVFSLPISYIPKELSFKNFSLVFSKRPFLKYLENSLFVSSWATILTIFSSSLFSLKLRYISKEKALSLQRWLLLIAIIPPTILVIPIFVLIKLFGLVNNLFGLILSYTFLNFPFSVWMLYAGFSKVPRELDEAAQLDGLSRFRILTKIILPLSKGTITATASLCFIFCWNEFLIALTLITDQVKYTVPVGISMLSGASIYEIPWGQINAAVTICTLPVILICAIFQKWLTEKGFFI